ncbi:MAG TPA: alpha/beta hydrolase [Actinomycetota bacterium]
MGAPDGARGLVRGPGCSLWIERIGAGEPVTVFAHGLGSSLEDVRHLTIPVHGTRVLFDFRGHGRSSADAESFDHEAMAADLRFVVDHAGATRALGVSLGAAAILPLLERLEQAVLVMPSQVDGPCPNRDGELEMARMLETLPLDEVAEHVADPRRSALAADPRWAGQIRAQVLRMNATGVPRAMRAYAGGTPPVADRAVLARATAAVLVAGHEGDPTHPADVARELASLIPNARASIWPEPFQMWIERRDEFTDLVAGFLNSSAPRAA